jgi:hypothetical protein
VDAFAWQYLFERQWLARKVHRAKEAWQHGFLDGRKLDDVIGLQQAGARTA